MTGVEPARQGEETLSLSILYVGHWGWTSWQRYLAFGRLGHRVAYVPCGPPDAGPARWVYSLIKRLSHPPDLHRANRALLRSLDGVDVLWVDKGLSIRARTLARAAAVRPGLVRVSFMLDDMMNPANSSPQWRAAIPHYDLHVTNKSYNVQELRDLGARDVYFMDNAYDVELHQPFDLTPEERQRYACDVGFVGSYEEERADQLQELARAGIRVSVWGAGWEGMPDPHPNLDIRRAFLTGTDFAKALGAARINLGFLRKVNRDLQTTRSVEIPASGGFMLAERTDEHLRLFEEGKEAEFFSSTEELIAKCRYYLGHEDERREIALGGLARCREGGYSYDERLAAILEYVQARHLRADRAGSGTPAR